MCPSRNCYYCGYTYGDPKSRELNYHGGLGRWICAFCFLWGARVTKDLEDLQRRERA
jgi:hypothetical protein